ncbi:MAG: RDD family protein [Phycisphaerae bacterium]|nr:RDD family protein [Phycisphaerae bacterium]
MRPTALPPVLLACLIACCAVAPSAASGGPRDLLAGNDKALWLIRAEEDHFGVAGLPTGGTWQWFTRQRPGAPTAVAAVGPQLHMLFPDGAFWAVGLDRNVVPLATPNHALWPDDPKRVILIEAHNVARAEKRASTLALVPRDAAEAATRPAAATRPTTASAPATHAATSPAESRFTLGLFQLTSDGWVHLGDVPQTLTGNHLQAVRATEAGGLLYVYLPGRQALMTHEPGSDTWSRVESSGALADLLLDGKLLALLRIKSQLVAVVADADARTLHVGTYLPPQSSQATGSWRVAPLRRDDEPFYPPSGTAPQVARMGDDLIAFVWHEQDGVRLATCDLSGRLTQRDDIGILSTAPPDTSGARIFEYFLWAVLVAILIPMFLLRPKGPRGFFTLPRRRPGHLAKRLLAGLIDLLPWQVLGFAVFRPPMPTEPWGNTEELMKTLQRIMATPEAAYFSIAWLVMYVGYCTTMEMRLGQTVGKRLMHLAVVNDRGGRPNLREAMLRNLLKIVELSVPFALPLLLLVPVLTRWRQRLGDMLARTAVIDADYLGPAEDEDQTDGSEQGGTNGKGGFDTTAGDDPQSGLYGPHGRTDDTRDD